jgi:hypothetical protein
MNRTWCSKVAVPVRVPETLTQAVRPERRRSVRGHRSPFRVAETVNLGSGVSLGVRVSTMVVRPVACAYRPVPESTEPAKFLVVGVAISAGEFAAETPAARHASNSVGPAPLRKRRRHCDMFGIIGAPLGGPWAA